MGWPAGFRAALSRLFLPTSRSGRGASARQRFNCDDQDNWGDRARSAATLIEANEAELAPAGESLTVADFGAGNERLRPLLAAALDREHRYLPFDLHPQLPTTTRLDVSKGLPVGGFDLGICLGLLEYLPDLPAFLDRLGHTCRFALISYVTSDSPVAMPREQRLEHNWVNHLEGDEIEAAFAAAGFSIVASSTCEEGVTTLWLLHQ
jgi:hypothetical protein